MKKDLQAHYKAVLTGRQSRAAGQTFEDIISRSCEFYSDLGIAEIEKTPEPMKPIKRLERGHFLAVFTKRAQPDYKGTAENGRSIVFEAKHTDTDRMSRDVISPEQEKRLNKHEKLGAECFVLVSFGFVRFFKVPWNIFRDMKQHFCRKYIVPADLKQYECYLINGVLRFLYQ